MTRPHLKSFTCQYRNRSNHKASPIWSVEDYVIVAARLQIWLHLKIQLITVIMWSICAETQQEGRPRHYCDISNHQAHDCLLNRFRRRRKKTSKLRVTGLCAGNSPVTFEFSAQRASYAEIKCFHLMTSSWGVFGNKNTIYGSRFQLLSYI